MERGGYIYILTNKNNTTLYVGVTANLYARIWQHNNPSDKNSFTARYNLTKLVYYELLSSIEEAIAREKQLKGGSRKMKEELINAMNPCWESLNERIEEFN